MGRQAPRTTEMVEADYLTEIEKIQQTFGKRGFKYEVPFDSDFCPNGHDVTRYAEEAAIVQRAAPIAWRTSNATPI